MKLKLDGDFVSYCQMRPDGTTVITLREGQRLLGTCINGLGSHAQVALAMLEQYRQDEAGETRHEVVISEDAQQWNQRQFESGL